MCEIMNPFINEVAEVIENGSINVRNALLPVHIRYFVADAPARAFVLNHFGDNSSDTCSECHVNMTLQYDVSEVLRAKKQTYNKTLKPMKAFPQARKVTSYLRTHQWTKVITKTKRVTNIQPMY